MSGHEWFWRVVYTESGEWRSSVRSVKAPHRAAAKQAVASHYDEPLDFERCYVPRPSWDCPICGASEGLSERPTMRQPPDWECLNCGTYAWGEPMDWEYLSNPTSDLGVMTGHREPDGPRWQAPESGDD